MVLTASILRVPILLAVLSSLEACAFETSPATEIGGGAGGGSAGSTGTPAPVSGSKTPSAAAMLARVDPNVTMNASPGEGVGVFSEYDAGGHWHLWWTCDTRRTSESCPFDVKVTVATGGITQVSTEQFTSKDTLTTPSTPASGDDGAIEARTTTTTGVSGVLFDTDPGATITVTATVGGLYDGKFLFWVQGGKVNDGFRGTVTDPLQLVGASP